MLECLPPTWIRWIEGHSSRMPFFLQNQVSVLPEVHTCRIEIYHVPPINPRNPTSRTYLKKIIAQLPWIDDRIFTEALFLEMKLGSNLIACQWGLTKLWYIYIMRSLVTEIDVYIFCIYVSVPQCIQCFWKRRGICQGWNDWLGRYERVLHGYPFNFKNIEPYEYICLILKLKSKCRERKRTRDSQRDNHCKLQQLFWASKIWMNMFYFFTFLYCLNFHDKH